MTVVIGRDPDYALVEEFRALPEHWQDEALLTIAKRKPGLLEEVFGDVELARAGAEHRRSRTTP